MLTLVFEFALKIENLIIKAYKLASPTFQIRRGKKGMI
jgi:hypothetical protein